MQKRRYRSGSVLAPLLLTLLVLAGALALVLGGLRQGAGATDEEALTVARDSILRAAVTCYSIEGRYPADYDYLRDNYGLAVDEERFLINYDAFAPNILPAVRVSVRVGPQ